LMIASAKVRDLRRSLYDDLGFVAFSGTPSYQVIDYGRPAGRQSRYRRLILPLSKSQSVVDQLLVLAERDRRPFGNEDHITLSRSGSATG
jgi:hypothetical protein